MSFWGEIVWGMILLLSGLFLEDWIDKWRGRRNGR